MTKNEQIDEMANGMPKNYMLSFINIERVED